MHPRISHKLRRAFTLVEIMIVVLIIGILLAIAIPNFMRARETSRAKACQGNLQHMESAKQQWAMENHKTATDTPSSTDLFPNYLKSYPTCPSNGTYDPGDCATSPSCSIGTNSTTDTSDDHAL